MQCKAIKKNGAACSNNAKGGGDFCGVHAKSEALNTSEIEPNNVSVAASDGWDEFWNHPFVEILICTAAIIFLISNFFGDGESFISTFILAWNSPEMESSTKIFYKIMAGLALFFPMKSVVGLFRLGGGWIMWGLLFIPLFIVCFVLEFLIIASFFN